MITTFVNDADFVTSEVPCIREWHVAAEEALGVKIAVQESRRRGRWWQKQAPPVYCVLLDVYGGSGARQAQMINFAPRDGSEWSINTYVPAQEVAAWMMGVITGARNAPDAGARKEGEG